MIFRLNFISQTAYNSYIVFYLCLGRMSFMFERYQDVLTHLPQYSKNIFRKGYFSWLLKQCLGWSYFSYFLLAFNFVLQIISLVQSFSQTPVQSILAFIGGNLSVACVLGISNLSGIQGWCGAISAICIANTRTE